MKREQILMLSLILLTCAFSGNVFSESYFYVMDFNDGNSQWTQWSISETSDSVVMLQSDFEGFKEFICDKDGSVRSMSATDRQGRLSFIGQRKEGSLIVSGILRERTEMDMGEGYWYQPIGPSMFNFVLSNDNEREFFIINPEDDKPLFMQIRKTGSETIEIDGMEKNAVKAELRLKGILAPFWSGRYWFCSDTGILLRYVGDSGPGTSVMTMELVSSSRKIAMIKGERE